MHQNSIKSNQFYAIASVLGALTYKGAGLNPDVVKYTAITRFGGYNFTANDGTHSTAYGLCLTFWCPIIGQESNVYMVQLMVCLGGTGAWFYRYSTQNPLSSDWAWDNTSWHTL